MGNGIVIIIFSIFHVSIHITVCISLLCVCVRFDVCVRVCDLVGGGVCVRKKLI